MTMSSDDNQPNSFDDDPDSMEVPSVTKLLNRKTLADLNAKANASKTANSQKTQKQPLPSEPPSQPVKSPLPDRIEEVHKTLPPEPTPAIPTPEPTPEISNLQTTPAALEISSIPSISISSSPDSTAESNSIESNGITLGGNLEGNLEIETNSTQKELEIKTNLDSSLESSPSLSISNLEIEHHGPPQTKKAESPSQPEIQVQKQGPKNQSRIQSITRKISRSEQKKLILWPVEILQSTPDPLAKAILFFLQKGAVQALFLGATPSPNGSQFPHFASIAAVQPQNKLAIWTGLKWDPTIVPELWDAFVISGCIELSPPGTLTNVSSHRNVVRSSFGLTKSEWLLIARVGPANACRGVVAIISPKSILNEFEQVKSILSTPISSKAS